LRSFFQSRIHFDAPYEKEIDEKPKALIPKIKYERGENASPKKNLKSGRGTDEFMEGVAEQKGNRFPSRRQKKLILMKDRGGGKSIIRRKKIRGGESEASNWASKNFRLGVSFWGGGGGGVGGKVRKRPMRGRGVRRGGKDHNQGGVKKEKGAGKGLLEVSSPRN